MTSLDLAQLDLCSSAGTLDSATDGQYVLHASPGVVLQLHGEHWAPVYLPALAPHLVHDLTPRAGQHGYPVGAVVRLPEGPKGRLAKYEQRLGAARSPSAVAPCEGPDLGRELRHDEREGNEGHVWRYSVDSGVACARCRCLGGIKPLTAELAFPEWEHDPHLWCRPQAAKDLGLGLVTCSLGDEETRSRARENLTNYLTGGFGRQTYVTSPQSRRAILQRASSDFDVGGRWQLPDDVTPETAGEEEHPHWLDLGAMLLGSAAHLGADADALAVWGAWLTGDEPEAPPREQWDPVYSDLLLRQLKPVLGRPGVLYVDSRSLLTALLRTGVARHMRAAHPAEEVVRDLRSTHELVRHRDERASVMVLFPVLDEKPERESGLLVARKVWGSGR